MPSTKPTQPRFDTMDELMDRIGNVPLSRIRLEPPPGMATEEDVIRIVERHRHMCELVDGTLVEKPMGYYESRLGTVLGHLFEIYLSEQPLGIVIGEGGMMRVEPKQVRIPDVAFYSWEQFPKRLLPRGSILDRVPELAVEILSPTKTKKEMQRKRKEYFLGGCKIVWEVFPEKKIVRVYSAPDRSKRVGLKGTLSGGTVLPGFKLPVAEWFKRAGDRE